MHLIIIIAEINKKCIRKHETRDHRVVNGIHQDILAMSLDMLGIQIALLSFPKG
jgi:hypothetical protein